MKRLTLLACGLPFLLAACYYETVPAKKKKKGGGDDGDTDTTQVVEPTYVGATGVRIKQIAIYQGLKRTLVVDGAPSAANEVPLVAGRDAVIRVFYETDASYDGGEVLARLTIDGFEPIEVKGPLFGSSVEESMTTTVNFVVPGDHVGTTFAYAVGLLQDGTEDEDNVAARYPASASEAVPIEGKASTFRVRIAPFQYNFDGSGRLPDLSPEGVERFRKRLLQLYPVSNVEVTVREPTPWSQRIGPDGSGWQQVGMRLFTFRDADNAPDDVYYYGMFNPEEDVFDFCGGGCLLGVTLLNDSPPATGEVQLRLALGVGFEEYVDSTAAHELGHSHGREHAPCGPGLDPQSIDRDFPHDEGSIGLWGLDPATLTLYSPQKYSDIMGYCDDQWVSDYTYKALLARGSNVNQPSIHGSTRAPAVLVSFDGDGNAIWGGETTSPRLAGNTVRARVTRDSGVVEAVDATWFPYDHLEGGMAIVPGGAAGVRKIDLDVGGRRITARP